MAYLLRDGDENQKAVALYSRCEDELLAKAELLTLLDAVPSHHNSQAVIGFYDVDPTFSIEEFKAGYRNQGTRYRKLMEKRQWILKNGWPFSERIETS